MPPRSQGGGGDGGGGGGSEVTMGLVGCAVQRGSHLSPPHENALNRLSRGGEALLGWRRGRRCGGGGRGRAMLFANR